MFRELGPLQRSSYTVQFACRQEYKHSFLQEVGGADVGGINSSQLEGAENMSSGEGASLVTESDEREEDTLLLRLSRFFSSPRTISFLKWTVISGVSVGACVIVIHCYVRYQRNTLHDALKSSIDALQNAVEAENSMLIRTIENQNRIIEAEHQTISTLIHKRAELENETVKRLLETIGQLTQQNAKSIEQLSHQQDLTSTVIKTAVQKSATPTPGQDTSIEKQIGSAVTYCVGKGVGLVKYLFGW